MPVNANAACEVSPACRKCWYLSQFWLASLLLILSVSSNSSVEKFIISAAISWAAAMKCGSLARSLGNVMGFVAMSLAHDRSICML